MSFQAAAPPLTSRCCPPLLHANSSPVITFGTPSVTPSSSHRAARSAVGASFAHFRVFGYAGGLNCQVLAHGLSERYVPVKKSRRIVLLQVASR